MKTLFCLLVMAAAPLWGGTISMDFTVDMDWRYDLSTKTMDPEFHPFSMNIQAIVDDRLIGSTFFPPGVTRILFVGGEILSPLPKIVDMGYDVSTLTHFPLLRVQTDKHLDVTSTSIIDDQFPSGGFDGVTGYSKVLEYTGDPFLPQPSKFGSDDLRLLLLSHLKKEYDYREDVSFAGGGFQHHGTAMLTNVVFDAAPVPEPSPDLLVVGALLVWAGVLAHKKTGRTAWRPLARFMGSRGETQNM